MVTYGITLAGCLLLGGRIGDQQGHRKMLIAGLVLILCASLAGAAARSLEGLVAARAGQGVGAALLLPNALAILTPTFPEGPARSRALGLFGAAGGAGAVVGSLAGGAIVEAGGWQWVFLLNVPVVAVLASTAAHMLRPDPHHLPRRPLDMPSAVLLLAGLMSIAFGIHPLADHGWTDFLV